MHLQSSKLNEFLNFGAAVKPNVLYPGLDSIKIKSTGDTIVLTKSNNNVFCEYFYFDRQPECEFLVNERMISGFIATIDAADIEFDLNGGVKVLSGKRRNEAQLQDIRFFPLTPLPTNEDAINITPDIISKTDIAMRYVSRAAIKTVASFVNIGADGIFATNQSAVYHYKCQLPRFLLDEDRLSALKILGQAMYNTSDNYDFFIGQNVAFAFIKTEAQPVNYAQMLQMNGENKFTIDRKDLLNFCIRVEYSTKQENPDATWMLDDDELYLLHRDADFEIGAEDRIPTSSNFNVPSFKFNTRIVKDALGPLPYQRLEFVSIGPHYKILTPEDINYTGILAGIGS